MDYDNYIQEFISSVSAKDKAEISRYNNQIELAVKLLAEMQLSKPTEFYYSELEKKFSITQKSKTTRDKSLNRVRNFFEYTLAKENQINMFENENQEAIQPEIEAEAVTPAQSERKKPGRKPTGEKKQDKIMIYVTDSLLADIQDLAYLNRTSIAKLVTGIVEGYISSQQERIKKFRELANQI